MYFGDFEDLTEWEKKGVRGCVRNQLLFELEHKKQ